MECRVPVLALAMSVFSPLMQANSPVTIKVEVPSDAQAAEHLFLHVEGLQLPHDSSGVVRIYANLPEADTTTSTNTDHFLGYITLMTRTSREAPVKRNISLDISRKSRELAGQHEVSITLVPLVRSAATAQSEKPTFRRIYLSPEP